MTAVGGRSLSGCSGVACSVHKPDAAPRALSRIGRRFGSWPAIVFALLSLPAGDMDGSPRMGRPARNGSPLFNSTREIGSLGIETRESATARSWPSIMTSSAREMMRPHKRLCSRRLPAQKATVRSPMLLLKYDTGDSG